MPFFELVRTGYRDSGTLVLSVEDMSDATGRQQSINLFQVEVNFILRVEMLKNDEAEYEIHGRIRQRM